MTIARELTVKHNKLYQFPIAELNDYRTAPEMIENLEVSSEQCYKTALTSAADIVLSIDIANSKAKNFDILVKCS